MAKEVTSGSNNISPDEKEINQATRLLNKAALNLMNEELPWYRTLDPEVRRQVGLVAGAGIDSFVAWYTKSAGSPAKVSAMFDAAPRELAQTITLRQTLAIVKVVVEAVEANTELLPGDVRAVREAVLRYSRDVAFSAAEVYAQAAEARGAQDARLEALAVDALLRGEDTAGVTSRAAELGWTNSANTTVVIGLADPNLTEVGLSELRRNLRRRKLNALVGVQAGKLVLVLGGVEDPSKLVTELQSYFAPGPIVIGPQDATLASAGHSASAALSAFAVAGAWPQAPRLVYSSDLLPERALNRDEAAAKALLEQCYLPLVKAGHGLVATLAAFLDSGRSLEAGARALEVHPNTVRTRLRKVAELTGWDPFDPREGFTLQVALVLGRLHDLMPIETSPTQARKPQE